MKKLYLSAHHMLSSWRNIGDGKRDENTSAIFLNNNFLKMLVIHSL